jgi:hypothetical protein
MTRRTRIGKCRVLLPVSRGTIPSLIWARSPERVTPGAQRMCVSDQPPSWVTSDTPRPLGPELRSGGTVGISGGKVGGTPTGSSGGGTVSGDGAGTPIGSGCGTSGGAGGCAGFGSGAGGGSDVAIRYGTSLLSSCHEEFVLGMRTSPVIAVPILFQIDLPIAARRAE